MSEETKRTSQEDGQDNPVLNSQTHVKTPQNWERLFLISEDRSSVLLRFLPDTKKYKADALLLIIYDLWVQIHSWN
jgi:hypothetical protein